MHRWDIISYNELKIEEWFPIQSWMNFNIKWKDYWVILMSVREDAPYADKIVDWWKSIIYEWHDAQTNWVDYNEDVKSVDQPYYTPNWKLTNNWKFYEAAQDYKKLWIIKKFKVYEKIAKCVRSYNWFFILADAWTETSWKREVFKFKLEAIDDHKYDNNSSHEHKSKSNIDNYLIPIGLKVEVYNRCKWRCVNCGWNVDLQYIHLDPKLWNSVSNIKLICANCHEKWYNKNK